MILTTAHLSPLLSVCDPARQVARFEHLPAAN
jgi:hypothetical protein